jgi:subfamily B ATP-binding cassette protein MsbA
VAGSFASCADFESVSRLAAHNPRHHARGDGHEHRSPWPLKIILDNVVGTPKPPEWLKALHISALRGDKMELAAVAAAGTLLIALLAAVSSYVENYFTESTAQWAAYDLRNQVCNHLQRLSLAYYDSHQVGTILSTIIDDVKTIQNFASSGTLSILIDLLRSSACSASCSGSIGTSLWWRWPSRCSCCCSWRASIAP